jgi:hypothetical protein
MPRIKKAAWVLDTPETAFNEHSFSSLAATKTNYNKAPEPEPTPMDYGQLRGAFSALGLQLTRCHRAGGCITFAVRRQDGLRYFEHLDQVQANLAHMRLLHRTGDVCLR